MNFNEMFHNYLFSEDSSRLNDDSKYSYECYVRNLCKNFLDEYARNILGNNKYSYIDLLFFVKDKYRIMLLNNTANYIELLKSGNFRVSKKTICNYSSGFQKLNSMICYDDTINTVDLPGIKRNDIQRTIANQFNSLPNKTFTKQDLIKKFLQRLKTQDRFYSNIMFPIRIILKLAASINLDKDILDVMIKRINDIKFIISEDGKQSLKLKQITKFVFTNKCVFINNSKLYTEKYQKNISGNSYVIQEPIIEKISIDHDKSLYKLINDNISEYPYLMKLSNDIKSNCKTYKNASELTKNYMNVANKNITTGDIKEIVNETIKLFNNMTFTAMDKRYNSSKNKSK